MTHFKISMIKSWVRIIGFALLIIAEGLGIVEEHVDKRKEE